CAQPGSELSEVGGDGFNFRSDSGEQLLCVVDNRQNVDAQIVQLLLNDLDPFAHAQEQAQHDKRLHQYGSAGAAYKDQQKGFVIHFRHRDELTDVLTHDQVEDLAQNGCALDRTSRNKTRRKQNAETGVRRDRLPSSPPSVSKFSIKVRHQTETRSTGTNKQVRAA